MEGLAPVQEIVAVAGDGDALAGGQVLGFLEAEAAQIAQAVMEEKRRSLMCFDRADGKLLWQPGVTYAEAEQSQQSNPCCSATPVTDGVLVAMSSGMGGGSAVAVKPR